MILLIQLSTTLCSSEKWPIEICWRNHETMFSKASEKKVFVMEAFHWYFHPANIFAKKLVSNEAEFGKINFFEGSLCSTRAWDSSDIRFNFSLAGGSTMDTGCYPISWMRFYLSDEPTSAKKLDVIPNELDDRVDSFASFEFDFADGKKAKVHNGLKCPPSKLEEFGVGAKVTIRSNKKELTFVNPAKPHNGQQITVTDLETGKCELDTKAVEEDERTGLHTRTR